MKAGKRFIAVACGIFLGVVWGMPDANAIEVSRAPTSVEIGELLAMADGDAAGKVREALYAAWRPARNSLPGEAARPAFRQWVRLGQWFSLLDMDEDQAWANFLGFYLGKKEKDGEMELVCRFPGSPFGEEIDSVPAEELLTIASRPGSKEHYRKFYLPETFEFRSGKLGERITEELRAAIARNPAFLDEFFSTLDPADFTSLVLQNLADLHAAEPDAFFNYPGLAIAMAVVFDQLPPPDWPHHQVDASSVPGPPSPPVEKFASLVAANESKQLLNDLRKMGADQLKFVVDALVIDSEIEWARKNVRFTRSSFDRAFSSIKYDTPRSEKQKFHWPENVPYTLANIKKLGGICVDQAYFAMLSGKAKGLPTLYFRGQGADGGHAWFGYLLSDTRWNLDCGRYENQNYAVGEALDPQIWSPITDHELKFLSGRSRRSPPFLAGQADAVMAEWFRNDGRAGDAVRAIDSAIAGNPQNPAHWVAKAQSLASSSEADAPARLVKHYETAVSAFQGNRDVQSKFQRELASALRTDGREEEAGQIDKNLIIKNRRERSDVSVGAAADNLMRLAEAGEIDEAMAEFRSLSAKLGRTGGGDFFYEIVRPFARGLMEEGKNTEALRVIEIARRSLRPSRGSILDKELEKMESAAKEN